MSYVTVEVDIDHGRIVPREPEKLPEKASGLLTILLPAGGAPNGERMSPQEALRTLQQQAKLTTAQAEAYLNEVRAERLAAEERRR